MTDFSTKYSYGDQVTVSCALFGDPPMGTIDSIAVVAHSKPFGYPADLLAEPKVNITYKVNSYWYCESELAPFVKPVAVGDVAVRKFDDLTCDILFIDDVTAVLQSQDGRRLMHSREYFDKAFILTVDA